MKDLDKTEELLNSYIDGELDDRRVTEAKRLMDHDSAIRDSYESFVKCRRLVELLPCDKAPANTFEEITHHLEREVLWNSSPGGSCKAGRKHLFFRRFAAVTAVLFLVVGLFAIIFDIFVPESARKQLVANFGTERKSQILYERPFADAEPAVVEDIPLVPRETAVVVPLSAKLIFSTDAAIQVDMYLGKAMMNRRLLDKTTSVVRTSDGIFYELVCDKSEIISLVSDLAILWQKCRDVQMGIETEVFDDYVMIDRISAADALGILRAESYSQRLRMAEDISKINAATPGAAIVERFYAVGGDIDLSELDLPKPVLAAADSVPFSAADSASKLIIIVRR